MDVIKDNKVESDALSTEKTLRALFDAIPESIFLMDRQGIVLQANEPFAARFGKNLTECLGRSIYDLLPPDVAAHRRTAVAEVLRTGKKLSFEGDLEGDLLLSGRKIHHICPLFGSDGEVNQLVVFSQDVTELKRKEESLRAAQEAAKSGTWEWDLQTNANSWSDELWQLYGLEPNECEPSFEAWRETLHPDDRERVVREVVEAARKGGDVNSEWRVPHRDGSEHWLMSRGRAVRNAAGKPVKMLGIVMDITERKRAEEQLFESNERYSSLFRNTLNGIAYCRMIFQDDRPVDFMYEHVNERFEILTGLKNVEGKRVLEIIPSISPELLEIYGRVARSGMAERFEYYLESLKMWFDMSVYSTQYDHFVAVFNVITERKRHEDLMEFRLRLLTLPDSCSIKDVLRATIDEAERLTESTVGFFHFLEADQTTISLQEWSTNTEKKLCRTEGSQGHYPLKDAGVWADAVRERRVVIHNNYEALANRKGMPQGHVSLTRELVVPIMRGEKITAIIGIGNKAEDYDEEDAELLSAIADFAWDIIGRKQAELSERRIQNELVKAQKLELVGRMAGGIAHDFNNMLCVILGHAEMALHEVPKSESVTENLQEIYNAAEKSADLANQLLAFARKQPLNAKVLNLNEIVGDMLNMLRRLLGEQITLVWNPGQNIFPVSMDSSHFDQIIVNLCVNARDAIVGMGAIVIETKNVTLHESAVFDDTGIPAGEYVMLSVSDNGCGIGEQDAEHIFEPFFTTKEPGKGTGLGLSTVYGLVKQNNGLINFSSEPGKGTEFTVYLPKYSGGEVLVKREHQAAPIKSGGETILIVDDEREILKLSKMMLEKQGYRVLTAGSPGQAIKIAEAQEVEIHLLLTDIIMPEMNGRDLSRKILSIYPFIKVLFMSGYTADIIASHGEVDTVTTLIQKPFTLKELTKQVYDILHPLSDFRE